MVEVPILFTTRHLHLIYVLTIMWFINWSSNFKEAILYLWCSFNATFICIRIVTGLKQCIVAFVTCYGLLSVIYIYYLSGREYSPLQSLRSSCLQIIQHLHLKVRRNECVTLHPILEMKKIMRNVWNSNWPFEVRFNYNCTKTWSTKTVCRWHLAPKLFHLFPSPPWRTHTRVSRPSHVVAYYCSTDLTPSSPSSVFIASWRVRHPSVTCRRVSWCGC